MQTYALGDLRLEHIGYIVQASSLVGDMFPDPVVLCYILCSNQTGALGWVLKCLQGAVRDSEVDLNKADSAKNCTELATSLCLGDPDSNILCRMGSRALGRWIQAIPSWPVGWPWWV